MKILLLNPYCSFDKTAYVFYRASVPYGLCYIAAYLRQHGIDVKICELGVFDEKDVIQYVDHKRCGIPDIDIWEIIKAEDPNIIGISTMYTVFHKDYVELIRLIKALNPNIHVVAGGNHASSFPQIMLDAGADQVVVGEGEQAFMDIIEGNREPIVHRDFIKSLDRLPFPAYDLIDFDRYGEVSNPFMMRTPGAGIMSSRGCPHDCIYCTANGVWQRKWRGRSAGNIVYEMSKLMWRGVKEFHFLDDNMAVDKDRLRSICHKIIECKLNIRWATPNGIPYWMLDEPLLRLMKKAGCYRVTFGIESGDPEIRKYIGKNWPLQKAKDIIQYANSIGMWTITTNIIGFPYETEEQIQRTIDFAKDCGTDFACFFTLLPHPSARVYQDFVKEGLIDPNDMMSALNEGGCRTVNFTKQQIKDFQQKAYNEFVRHKMWQYIKKPWLLLQKIHSVEDLLYLIRVGWLGLQIKLRQGKKIATSKDYIYGDKQYVKR